MGFREALLPIVDAARNVRGPLGLNIQLNQLSIVRRTWSGEHVGEGVVTDEEILTLPKKYPVRYLTQAQMDGTAGSYTTEDVLVDHITPTDGAGVGYTTAQLAPSANGRNDEIVYVLDGSHRGEFGLVELRAQRPFTWQLVLRRTLAVPSSDT